MRNVWRSVVCLVATTFGGAELSAAATSGDLVVAVRSAAAEPRLAASVRVASVALPSPLAGSVPVGESRRFPAVAPGSYTIDVACEGFRPVHVEASVRQNETTTLAVTLEPATTVRETLEVVVPAPIVDTSTPKVSEHLDLEAIRALPIPRDYRGFAQLVAGVNVVPNSDGLELRYEPASKAGNFYQDRGGLLGSRDNHYLVDGFDFTDMGGGDGQLRINADAIREQEVVTSGVPAALGGGAGYVVNLLTRAGGPRYAGSADLYFRKPSWYSGFKTDDTRLQATKQDKWDAGATLGGPAIRERLWFFASLERRNNSDDVQLSTSASPVPRTETYSLRRDNGVAKLTWTPGASDTVSALYLGEQRDSHGSPDVNQVPGRYATNDQTWWTAQGTWEHRLGGSGLVAARYAQESLEDRGKAEHPELGPPNTLLYPPGTTVPAYLRDLGSSGDDGVTQRDKRQGDVEGSWYFDAHGSHALAAGFSDRKWTEEVRVDLRYGLNLTSLAPSLAGMTFAEARDASFLPPSEYDAIYTALVAAPSSPAFAFADANGDGAVSPAEFASLRFASTAGNSAGINFLRNRTLYAGASAPYQKDRSYYLQDEWRRERFTVLAGVRVEDRSYYASDGATILAMDPAWYPRLGVAWDVGGKGRQRLSLQYGVYADPLRSSMIRFVGNATGSIFADEVAIGDGWFDYRQRGAARLKREAAFAPNLENEEEEEIQLTWGYDLGEGWGVLAQAWRREDSNLIEDYDPNVYFNPAVAGRFALDPSVFGYPPSGAGNVAFFLGNLVGARRVAKGLDVALTRRERDNWSATLQYSWKDAKGNSNSDAAADLQGDFLDLDPRQPYMWGPLPGTIENQAKLFGSWRSPWKIEIGGLLYWNDGAVFTEATAHRPTGSNILYNYRRADGTYVRTGQQKHPGYTTLDLRFALPLQLSSRNRVDLYVDVYNALDSQKTIRVEEAHNAAEFTVYREPRLLLEPRRWQVGARFSFE